jgi:hypothetical protein
LVSGESVRKAKHEYPSPTTMYSILGIEGKKERRSAPGKEVFRVKIMWSD